MKNLVFHLFVHTDTFSTKIFQNSIDVYIMSHITSK